MIFFPNQGENNRYNQHEAQQQCLHQQTIYLFANIFVSLKVGAHLFIYYLDMHLET